MNRSLGWAALILAVLNILLALAEQAMDGKAAPASTATQVSPEIMDTPAKSLVLSVEVGGAEAASPAADVTAFDALGSQHPASPVSTGGPTAIVSYADDIDSFDADIDVREIDSGADASFRASTETSAAIAVAEGADAVHSAFEPHVTEEATADTRCVKISGITNNSSAERVHTKLAEIMSEGYIGATNVPIGLLYWVHVPTATAQAEAGEILRNLQSKGVDAFVITTEGELKGAVSLGVFQDLAGAERLKQSLGNVGYPVAIKSLPRSRTIYSISGALREAMTSEDIEGKLDGLEQGLRVEVSTCESIAY